MYADISTIVTNHSISPSILSHYYHTNWLTNNYLLLNPNKTLIPPSTTIKYLGIHINNKLTIDNTHINLKSLYIPPYIQTQYVIISQNPQH